MSKIYNMYLKLKEKDHDKLYLFKVGKFYIFLGEDCDTINDYVVLKKTKFSSETQKCGFPESVLDDYLRVFNNQHLNIEIVKDISSLNNPEEVINKINKYYKNIDLNNINLAEALTHLNKIKELLNE